MNDDPNLPDEERGLYPKYRAVKIEEGHNWEQYTNKSLGYQSVDDGDFISANEVTRPFIMMFFDDLDTKEALLVYANTIEDRYPLMAADIRKKILEQDFANLQAKLMGNQGKTVADQIIPMTFTADGEVKLTGLTTHEKGEN